MIVCYTMVVMGQADTGISLYPNISIIYQYMKLFKLGYYSENFLRY
jgi:hypothetical protein